MPKEIFYDSTFVMKKGYPKVTKLGGTATGSSRAATWFTGRTAS